MASVPDFYERSRSGFRQLAAAFLLQPGLPFSRVLPAERIQRVFVDHGNLFGGTVYTTPITVWSFLSQVLRDGKGEFLSIRFHGDLSETMVFRRKSVEEATAQVMAENGIPRRGSDDLMAAWAGPTPTSP